MIGHSMHRLTLLFAVMSLTLAGGCTKDGDPLSAPPLPQPPSMIGTWEGTVPGQMTFTLVLTEDRNNITGMAHIAFSGTTASFNGTVYGKKNYPTLYFGFYVSQFQPVTFTGSFISPMAIDGKLNDSGFSNYPIVISKR